SPWPDRGERRHADRSRVAGKRWAHARDEDRRPAPRDRDPACDVHAVPRLLRVDGDVIGRARVAALAAATAWLAVSAAFSAALAASYGPLVECPPSTATLQALVSMDTYLDGALATRYRDADLNEGPMGCLGSAEVTVVAFRSAPEGLGGAYAYAVEPDWMDTWQQRRWFLTPTDAENSPGFGAGPFLAAAV